MGLLDQIADAIGTLCLVIICIAGPIMLLGWAAFKWSERRDARDKKEGQKMRKSLGYE